MPRKKPPLTSPATRANGDKNDPSEGALPTGVRGTGRKEIPAER